MSKVATTCRVHEHCVVIAYTHNERVEIHEGEEIHHRNAKPQPDSPVSLDVSAALKRQVEEIIRRLKEAVPAAAVENLVLRLDAAVTDAEGRISRTTEYVTEREAGLATQAADLDKKRAEVVRLREAEGRKIKEAQERLLEQKRALDQRNQRLELLEQELARPWYRRLFSKG